MGMQLGQNVYVVSGQYEIQKPEGTLARKLIKKINVGAAKLASEVNDITKVNAIVIGGPCANKAAAELLGNKDCESGFQPGKAMIKMFEHGETLQF